MREKRWVRIGIEQLLKAAKPLIDLALEEDLASADGRRSREGVDPSSAATVAAEALLCARLIAKGSGVIAGLPVAEAVFRRLDPNVAWTAVAEEGQEVTAGETVAFVNGRAVSLLTAERVALNFLQRSCGIATLTRSFVNAVLTTDVRILDTRKTAPGFRILDKYAVRMGGGYNHRLSLTEMMMIKDNHIDAVGSLTEAVHRARSSYPGLPLEAEVDGLTRLDEALAIHPPLERILLDNMSPQAVLEAVRRTARRVPLEVSGNVSLQTVGELASTGIDFISIGALTHSAPAFDLSMRVEKEGVTTGEDVAARIRDAREHLGRRLVILGHHYLRDEVIVHADVRGDSLALAREAAMTDAEFVIFCGVRFMAETAACLLAPGQKAYEVSPDAGCTLADTASLDTVREAWAMMEHVLGNERLVPVVYVNSSPELKAFCGERGGATCTSANAGRVLRWALSQGPRVLFLPDRHLGRNTAHSIGLCDDDLVVWRPERPPADEELRSAQVVLWSGACNVHQRFCAADVCSRREEDPAFRVAVHPECPTEVVSLADDAGSTSQIIRWVEQSPPGTRWAIGTETRFVHRLAAEHLEQTIRPLAKISPYCSGMGEVTAAGLASVLESIVSGDLTHQVFVEPATAKAARTAIDRMLALDGAGGAGLSPLA